MADFWPGWGQVNKVIPSNVPTAMTIQASPRPRREKVNENKQVTCYKLTRPDGWDFYTGKTILYRGDGIYPHTVKVPSPAAVPKLCRGGILHASQNPNDCFDGASIPCSAFRVRGAPVCGSPEKWGFHSLEVLEEISPEEFDTLFGWRYSEAVNPVNPFRLPSRKPTKEDIQMLKTWASIGALIGDSTRASVWDSVWGSVWDSVWDSVWNSAKASIWDSVWDSARASVWDSVWAYVGSFFTGIRQWAGIEHEEGVYPFQCVVDLWERGLVPSYDGTSWRLHSGPTAEIVWEGEITQ